MTAATIGAVSTALITIGDALLAIIVIGYARVHPGGNVPWLTTRVALGICAVAMVVGLGSIGLITVNGGLQ